MPAATILVVDDESIVRAVVARTLQSAGFAVLEAEHGEAALALAGRFSGTLALAIVDMNMPVMTGSEFAREFRLMRPSVPVLFISGREPVVPGARLLLKPFGPDQLLETVAEVLGQAHHAERTGAEAASTRLLEIGRVSEQVHDAAKSLKQRSRFLCRKSAVLRSRSNDLLTVAMFHRQACRATPDVRRAQLKLS